MEQLREVFLARMPNFGDFRGAGPAYRENERAYKDEFAGLCKDQLLPDLFPDQMTQAAADEVSALTHRLLTKRLETINQPQNFIGWRSVASLREMEPGERAQFASAFGDLLFGAGESPGRLERFVGTVWPVMDRTLRGNPYAHSRIFPTVFLMARDPVNDIAVRTNKFDSASRTLLGRRLLENAPFDAWQYRVVLDFSRAVYRQLELWAWRPRDLIDVQTFLWVSFSSTYGESTAESETED
jgi:5-methylcytosine-specific restriction protein B